MFNFSLSLSGDSIGDKDFEELKSCYIKRLLIIIQVFSIKLLFLGVTASK